MKFKNLVSLLLVGVSVLSLTSCGSTSEISELNDLTALNAESDVIDDYYLSYTDEQELIYAQVSNRQLLDLSTLTSCSDNEIQQVLNYMENVDKQLTGGIYTASYSDVTTKYFIGDLVEDDAVIDSYFTDYLLTFFEQSPYYWQRSKTVIRGIDSNSRSIIVDVTYETIDYEKTVKGNSTIVQGTPNYTNLVRNRYLKWVNILETKKNNPTDPNLAAQMASFIKYYGNPSDIIAEQNSSNPTTSIYLTGNQTTYNGLIDSDAEKSGGKVTVRYVLVPEYVMGINLGISCKHMYILDYNVNTDITEGLEVFNKEGYATVTDSVYNLIYSYFTCIDENDFNGLYKLTSNFGAIDKYYGDLFDSSYLKHDGFSVSLFNITGTHVTCGVTISSKERAKGTDMSFPIYTDRYYMELELIDDRLKVNNMVLLSRRIEGEPSISSDDADTTGFSAIVDLDNDDKVAIEKLICNFSAIQLLGDYSSDDFSDIVDISITTNQLASLQSAMTSLNGVQKVVFLQNYQQGTSNYASVKCKELYKNSNDEIVEALVTYEFILKGGKWYVYNYIVNSSVMLDTTNLVATNSLCLVSPGKIDAYTSQIKGSTSTNLDDIEDASKTFEHEHYTPDKRHETDSTVTLLMGNDVTDVIFDGITSTTTDGMTYADFQSSLDILRNYGHPDISELSGQIELQAKDLVACNYNKINGYYTAEDTVTILEPTKSNANQFISSLNEIYIQLEDESLMTTLNSIINFLSGLNQAI